MWGGPDAPGVGAPGRRAGLLHAEAPRGPHPDLPGRGGRRAQTGYRPLRRSQGLHGALESGEEDGTLFALAFPRGPGGQDAGHEVLRRVGVRRGAPGRRLRERQVLTTFIAKAATRNIAMPACRACDREAGAAVVAEPRRRRIRMAAPRARHRTRRRADYEPSLTSIISSARRP